MSLSKNIYELSAIAGAGCKVISSSYAIVNKDVANFYNNSIITSPLRSCDTHSSMWNDAKSKSLAARSKAKPSNQTRNYSTRSRAAVRTVSSRNYSTNSFSHQYDEEEENNRNHIRTSIPSSRLARPTTTTAAVSVNLSAPAVSSSTRAVARKTKTVVPEFEMAQSEVPSTRLARIFHYGSLAAGVGMDVAKQGLKHYATGNKTPITMKSLFLSPANIERMAKKFSKMRGAALKIGQMMSFQDSSILPAEIQQVLMRVQNSAHYMPPNQLEKVMLADLGNDWRTNYFASFDDIPMAAASIGQVHNAVTEDLTPVVVKVQYPGVVDSIDSDLNNLLMLLTASSILPAGLFLDKTIANARTELKWECDYIREAQNLIRFRDLVADDAAFTVPKVFHNLCGEHVLTMEKLQGVEIVKGNWDQETKNWIATNIMRLCLMEIGQFKFMQTDPNWANFLYNEKTGKIELLDFGAAREFNDEFIEDYVNVLRAAVRKDRKSVERYSKKLGYLTGLESQQMTDAHIESVMVLGEAFSPIDNNGQAFNFKNQTITDRVRGNIGLMLNERLTPPPEETYSLHRKLSGVYLLCARLGATVPCEQLFRDIIGYE